MGMALEKLPSWPAALTREEALAYTRVGEAQLRAWERARKVHFRTRGARGAAIVLRAELEAALADLFAGGGNDIGEDLDFGDD